jgi:hypothetical protein
MTSTTSQDLLSSPLGHQATYVHHLAIQQLHAAHVPSLAVVMSYSSQTLPLYAMVITMKIPLVWLSPPPLLLSFPIASNLV